MVYLASRAGWRQAAGALSDEVKKMQDAWRKSVIIQVALWSQPYV